MTPEDFIAFCKTFLGLPYIWGADGPDAYDCSGLAQVLLARLGLDPVGDQTAHDLYRHFQKPGHGSSVSIADCGCLAFYGKPRRIGHIAICLDAQNMIEAGGGGSETTTVERAREQGAKVRIRPIKRRSDLVALIRPAGLPWQQQPTVENTAPSNLYVPNYRLLDSELIAGVEISPEELKAHLRALDVYRSFILEAAGEYGIEPAVISGIGSRESGWGTSPLLKPKGPSGTGDWAKRKPRSSPPLRGNLPADGQGFGRGLMQIDWDSHEFARTGNWRSPRENILYGAKTLYNKLNFLEKSGVNLSQASLLRAGIASYNAGEGNILKVLRNPQRGIDHVDDPTAHRNYSADVLARAIWFREHGVF